MKESFFLLHDKFKESCVKFPDKICIKSRIPSRNISFSFQEIYELSRRVSFFLQESQIVKGDRVAIILENCLEWPSIYFGILSCGAIAVPLDPQVKIEELVNFLKDCQARVAFISEKIVPFFKTHLLQKVVVVGEIPEGKEFINFIEIKNQELRDFNLPQIEPQDSASILYTSGTTAVPKGVVLTHRNFAANFQSINKLKLLTRKDVFLSVLPFYHAYAFMATLIFPLFLGAKIVFPASLKSQDLTKCIREEKVTILVGVPELFLNLLQAIFAEIKSAPLLTRIILKRLLNLNYNFRKVFRINLGKFFFGKVHSQIGKNLRFMVSGGARLEPKVALDLFKMGFTILEGYGLTETSPIVSLNLPGKEEFGSVGPALPGVEIKINNPGEEGVGEVVIRGANVFGGYFHKPAETSGVLKDSWFYTGDLGFLDKNNFLHLTGRSKEVIVLSSGKNIYPEEIESYYQKSSAIKELCVLEAKDDRDVVTLQAVVVPNFAYFEKQEGGNIYNKIKWVFENVSAGLPPYKRISGFTLIKDDLPRTRLGKIKRYAVKERYSKEIINGKKPEDVEKKFSGKDLALLSSSIGRKITEFLQNTLSLKNKPDLDDHLELDLGVDSLTKVEIVSGLEKMFRVSIPDKLAQEITSVRLMILKLSALLFGKTDSAVKAAPLEPSWDILLATEPNDQIKKEISLQPSVLNKVLTFSSGKALFLILRLFWRLKIKGKENIPAKGNFIFYANHNSYLDGPALAAALPLKTELGIYFIGWREIFQHPAIKWANKMARLVPIDSSADLVNALKTASFILRNQKSICIFPEGQRSIDGQVKDFKKGIGILVKELKIPVIPVAIKGSFSAWPRTSRLPQAGAIKVVFGLPISYNELLEKIAQDGKTADYEILANCLRQELVKLFSKDD